MTGKRVGEGDIGRLKQSTRSFQLIFLALGLVTGALIFAASAPCCCFIPS